MFYFKAKKTMEFFVKRVAVFIYSRFGKPKKNLDETIEYAESNVNVYKGYKNFLDFPLIDSEGFTLNRNKFISKKYPKPFAKEGYSSATTGKPRSYLRSICSIMHEMYYQEKYFQWNGMYKVIFRGDRFIDPKTKDTTSYIDIPWIKEFYLSSYDYDVKGIIKVVKKLILIEKKCLWAYPSLAAALAEINIEYGLGLTFDLVATSSEVLTSAQAKLIEESFKCKVKDWYGQAERVVALYKCDSGNYHPVPNYSFVEYKHIDKNMYEMIGTTLCNRSMPLIRYRTGDVVVISEENCKCGYEGVNILEIKGRKGCVIDFNGRKISSTSMGCLLKSVPHVLAYQICFKQGKNLIAYIVKNHDYTQEDEKAARVLLEEVFTNEEYAIEYVPEIGRTVNGKVKIVNIC